LQYQKSALNNGPLLVYLAARDKSRGEEALASINADSDLKKAEVLAADGGLAGVEFHQLDIADSASIKDFAAFLKERHPDGIDFVINNAGMAMDGFSAFSSQPRCCSLDISD
jgi:carbonyl reductase 1